MRTHGQFNLTNLVLAILLLTGSLTFFELRIQPQGVERVELRPT